MIEPMLKVIVAGRINERNHLLAVLRDLGVLHLDPVQPPQSTKIEECSAQIARTERAINVLSRFSPGGPPPPPELSSEEAVDRILLEVEELEQLRQEVTVLQQQLERQRVWGAVNKEDIDALGDAGVDLRFYRVKRSQVGAFSGECLKVCGPLEDGRVLVAAAGAAAAPAGAEQLPFPEEDAATLKQELAVAQHTIRRLTTELNRWAGRRRALQHYLSQLREKLDFRRALDGGFKCEKFFAVQGWIPKLQEESLRRSLSSADLDCAFCLQHPEPDDNPPTLLRHPLWVKPIAGLFDVLRTVPGYRESDLSMVFMITLPIFAAIILGDAGYGFLLLLCGFGLYKTLVRAAGLDKIWLMLTIGAATLVYGILVGSYFGFSPEQFALFGGYAKESDGKLIGDLAAAEHGSGFWAAASRITLALGLFWNADADLVRVMLTKLSFILGGIHLVASHTLRFSTYFPDQRALAELGWMAFILGMLGVIWVLFFGVAALPTPLWVVSVLLGLGALLAVLFSNPHPNFFKRVFMGIATSLLGWLGAFGDLMSYIRLMAVGLASFYIAMVSDDLAAQAALQFSWIAGVSIAVIGHLLNVALGAIAILAHGVRLNMLEFSNNAGVQWSGYSYDPFARRQLDKE
jgi:V/A-type H+/Na+-transporting ATPase subunit I